MRMQINCFLRALSNLLVLVTSPTHFVFSGAKPGNERFALDLAAWTFQESLVLRIDSTTHHLTNETAPREHYTINENIVRHLLLMN
jgi:Oligosaccharyltransferase 48 kDa subunit beta